ncbi:MAG: PTS sugar transporter subunit IIB [Turicibacter sp.]|nr:PTS sugar transporter subunit IIB [Turicibacter sp.]
MKIKLFCNAGMSTSLLVERMKEAAAKRGLEVSIVAYPESTLEAEVKDCDVALLGPQVRYVLGKAQAVCGELGIPVDVIPMQFYGMVNGEAVLDHALELVKNHQ